MDKKEILLLNELARRIKLLELSVDKIIKQLASTSKVKEEQ